MSKQVYVSSKMGVTDVMKFHFKKALFRSGVVCSKEIRK